VVAARVRRRTRMLMKMPAMLRPSQFQPPFRAWNMSARMPIGRLTAPSGAGDAEGSGNGDVGGAAAGVASSALQDGRTAGGKWVKVASTALRFVNLAQPGGCHCLMQWYVCACRCC
jgi:hypothetical protein